VINSFFSVTVKVSRVISKMNVAKFLNLLLIAICFMLCAKIPACQSQVSEENNFIFFPIKCHENCAIYSCLHLLSCNNAVYIFSLGMKLTFSPSWGKRTPSAQSQVLFGDSNALPQSAPTPVQTCNPKMESMLLIYRLIQNEAQKMLECNSQQK
jgi:hypothetical protein